MMMMMVNTWNSLPNCIVSAVTTNTCGIKILPVGSLD